MTSSDRWWEAAFGPHYRTVYAHRDDATAAREAGFAAGALRIARDALVLDAGCGDGRHARSLVALGARLVGADRSPALLAQAIALGGGPRYVAADFRALPFRDARFAHVVSFFTSFGYFDDAGNAAHLHSLRRVLRADGGLLLDFLNSPRVATTLVPETTRRLGARTIVERRAIRRGRVEKEVEVLGGDEGPLVWRESVRLYSRDEVESMLRDARFAVRAVHGDLAGAAWSVASERLVVIGAAA